MMEWVMERGVDAYLAGVAVKGLALLALTAMAALALRRGSSASRHWAWLLGLAGLLGLPVVGLVAPRWTVELPEAVLATRVEPPAVAGGRGASKPAASRERPADGAAFGGSPGPAMPGVATPGEAVASPPAAPAASVPRFGPTPPAPRRDRDPLPLGSVLLVFWALGATGLLIRLLGSHVALWRVQAGAHPYPEGPVTARARSLASRVGIRRPVRVLQGQADAVPMSWGTVRPSILLPSGAGSWPAARVDAVLLHELAHVRRRDCLAQLVAEAAVAIHWYNPLAWFAAHRLRVEREHACDDDVLRQGTRASQYASELVALARELRPAPVGATAAVPILGPADLRARVRAVLDARRPRTLPGRVVGAGVAVAAVVVMALATVTPAQARTEVRDADGAAEGPSPRWEPVADVSDAPEPQAATCGMASDGWRRSSISSNDGERTTLQWSRPGCAVDVRIQGAVDFTDDFRGVERLAPDALVRIEENDGDTRRWLEITAGPDGRPTFRYRLNGQDRNFDAA
ncbi:MAG TPA: M56 family metallopeptidase, partial [Longimicrobiales bacterium]|nr:M56 family metallopeptidase [Longimicrobiales bacterium]